MECLVQIDDVEDYRLFELVSALIVYMYNIIDSTAMTVTIICGKRVKQLVMYGGLRQETVAVSDVLIIIPLTMVVSSCYTMGVRIYAAPQCACAIGDNGGVACSKCQRLHNHRAMLLS